MEKVLPDGTRMVRSVCWGGGGCEGPGCGIWVHVKDGKLVKVEGDDDCPTNMGRLCPKGLAFPQLVHHPDRLTKPLKRVGRRGEGKWKEISWEEAYDTIEREFKKIIKQHGPWSIAFCQGTGRDIMAYVSRLAYSVGSANWNFYGLSGQSCYIPRVCAQLAMFGRTTMVDVSQFLEKRYDDPRYKPPEVLVVWGANLITSSSDDFFGPWNVDVMKRGTKLIVIDPRLTFFAARADKWLQIRPGTDGPMALAWLHHIIYNDLYDKEFVGKWVTGFDKLKERVKKFTPEWASKICRVPAEDIKEAAEMYAMAANAALQTGVSIDHQRSGVTNALATYALMAITGNMDVPGANVFAENPFGIYQPWFGGWGYNDMLTDEQRKMQMGYDEFPLQTHAGFLTASPDMLMEAALTGYPYPVKAAYITTNNPIACMSADTRKCYDSLRAMDFLVCADMFMTPTAQLCDIVLPVASCPERDSIRCVFQYCGIIEKALRLPDTKTDAEILLDLGKRFAPQHFPWKDVREMLDEILKPSGKTFKQLSESPKGYLYPRFDYHKHEQGLLRPDGKPGFATPSGKIELFPTLFKESGYDPLPDYVPTPEGPEATPELYEKYPIVLTSGIRSWVFFHSEHRQIPWLRAHNPWPTVDIHPETAAARGIQDGDWVWIENQRGRAKMKAVLTRGVAPGVAVAQHGWWFPEREGREPYLNGIWEHNINQLTEMKPGPTGFGTQYRGILCEISRAESGPTEGVRPDRPVPGLEDGVMAGWKKQAKKQEGS